MGHSAHGVFFGDVERGDAAPMKVWKIGVSKCVGISFRVLEKG